MGDSQRDKAAAAFGKAFMDEARKPVTYAPNSMVQSQQIAQARPIPTYAKGGPVRSAVAALKKADAAQDAKLVAKAIKSVTKKAVGGAMKPATPMTGRPTGPIDRRAAGGAGKVRKGQAKEPGRGPKLGDTY